MPLRKKKPARGKAVARKSARKAVLTKARKSSRQSSRQSAGESAQSLQARVTELESKLKDMRVLEAFTATLLHFTQEVDDILWDVARLAVARLGLEDCVIYLIDKDRGDLVQRAAFGPKNPKGHEILEPIRIPLGKGIVGSVAVTGNAERIQDTLQDPRYIQDDQMRRSELAVPIFHGETVIGVLDSEHSQRDFFTAWHQDLFVAIASMAGGRIAAARLAEERYQLATRDTLTGLANRSELIRELQKRLDQATSTVSVIFLDLDHFGVINDSLSHLAGDELLCAIGDRIKKNTPAGGFASRFGGDEFVVVVDCTLALGRSIAEKMCASISEVLRGGALAGLQVACSGGVAVGIAGNAAVDVLHQADLAMYEAKRTGRNRVQVHDSNLAARRRREQRIVVDLMRSIDGEDGTLVVNFQPIYTLPGRKMVAAEVLARWVHPELGLVSPSEFVPAAERTGNIHRLGQTILCRAFSQIRQWKPLATNFVFNVNVSPLQLQQDGFAAHFMKWLKQADVPPTMIACEVTESALLGDEAKSLRVLNDIAHEGVKLVLDDFGTGYASLSTLVRYPFHAIKIDQRFVRGLIHANEADAKAARTVVSTVLALSQELELDCTAEGVETLEQLLALQDFGCTLVQGRGPGLSDAVAPEVFELLLRDR